MPEYTVHFKSSAFTSVKVEAEDAADAIDKASGASMPTLCAQCSGWGNEDAAMEISDVWEADGVTGPDGKYEDVD